jgi:GxxExxY protein
LQETAENAKAAEAKTSTLKMTNGQRSCYQAQKLTVDQCPVPCICVGMAKDRLNALTEVVIGAAIDVHRELGPGLLESAYEACLVFELVDRGLKVERQKPLPVVYRGVSLDCAYRMDIVIDDQVILEVKSVERLHPVHDAQMISYLRLYRRHVGLVFNFNVKLLSKGGWKRLVHDFPDE